MKFVFTLLALTFFQTVFSQKGTIKLKLAQFKPGAENLYIYQPRKGLLIPDKATVKYIFDFGIPAPVPLVKNESGYEFSVTVPDSAHFVMFAVFNDKNVIDNNNDSGYVVYLKNKTRAERERSEFSKLRWSGFENSILHLDLTPAILIPQFEKLYTQNPLLKKEQDAYISYLQMKYRSDPDVKPEVMQYAALLQKKGDEKSLAAAMDFYELLNMSEKAKDIKKMALAKYPKGFLAKNLFFSEVYQTPMPSEQFYLDKLADYQKKFGDTSSEITQRFYYLIINNLVFKKDMAGINKYEPLFTYKPDVANIYNNTAWEFSGGNLTSAGRDLDFAEQISKRSVIIMKSVIDTNNSSDFQLNYIYYVDTYALILYKEKKYDSAYKYQEEIYKLDSIGMGSDGRERLSAYMEKIMGPQYTKDFIERQIMGGNSSLVMVEQLRDIYKILNLPDSAFNKMKQTWTALANKKLQDAVIAKYGSTKAIDFTLTNLEGKEVKLSDYKGKVVVLDFWATWCGPCRASFPNMQKLVTDYKDKDVAFFFVDTWQQGKPSEITKEVSKFIADNKYSFNVLLDFKNEIVDKYKIKGIPTRIVIDKNGALLSAETSEDNLKALLDDNLN